MMIALIVGFAIVAIACIAGQYVVSHDEEPGNGGGGVSIPKGWADAYDHVGE